MAKCGLVLDGLSIEMRLEALATTQCLEAPGPCLATVFQSRSSADP